MWVFFVVVVVPAHIVNDGTHVKIDTYLETWIRKKEIS